MRVRAEMVDDEETRSSLVTSVEEMQTMVEETLTFARGMSASEASQSVEVGALLEDLRTGSPVPFLLDRGGAICVRIRPTAMRRALRNVIENAARYGKIARVAYSVRDNHLMITVEDDGPGIPETDLERVFDPFFRLEQSRSLETGGHGLGLSIARTIITAHGGDIWLANRQEGGLCASILIPLEGTSQETSVGDHAQSIKSSV
tara:strand:+ start:62 stop:673 length:612 start_codon:yes stop_codon:yes gene_type:complete